jgi:hypothetical protein
MCYPLILCREETMSRAEGSNRMTRCTKERTKIWHDKRMRKKECDMGDKMLMNSSSKEASRRKGRPPQVIYPSSHGVITLQ